MNEYRIIEEKYEYNDNKFIPQYRVIEDTKKDEKGELIWFNFYDPKGRMDYLFFDDAILFINKYKENLIGPTEVIIHQLT